MPVAGKTGTTDDSRSIWFAGYTPYYNCAVWGGYDNNDILPEGDTYRNYHKTLWNSIMSRIHQDLPVTDFSMPSDIVTASVCRKSENLPFPVSALQIPEAIRTVYRIFCSWNRAHSDL